MSSKESVNVVSYGVVEIKVDMKFLDKIMKEPYTEVRNGVLYFRNKKE